MWTKKELLKYNVDELIEIIKNLDALLDDYDEVITELQEQLEISKQLISKYQPVYQNVLDFTNQNNKYKKDIN